MYFEAFFSCLLFFTFYAAGQRLESNLEHHASLYYPRKPPYLEAGHDELSLSKRELITSLLLSRRDLHESVTDWILSRREEQPFKDVTVGRPDPFPENLDPNQSFYVPVKGGNAVMQVPSFGGYSATGEVKGPVTKEKFVERARQDSLQVKEGWENAPGYQKIGYQKDAKLSNAIGKTVMTPRLGNNGEPDPVRGPMSTAQLTGHDSANPEYRFASQNRPAGEPKFTEQGQALLDKSRLEQARKLDPNYDEKKRKADEERANYQDMNQRIHDNSLRLQGSGISSDERTKLLKDTKALMKDRKATEEGAKYEDINQKIHDNIRKLQGSSLTPEGRKQLTKDTEAFSAERKNARKEADKLEKENKATLNNASHRNQLKCPECGLVAGSADQPEKLNGALQQAYGWRDDVNGGQWGPQQPCDGNDIKASGKGKSHGCKQIQGDNGIVDTYDTAVELEKSLCKRGSPSCKLKQKPGSAQEKNEQSNKSKAPKTKTPKTKTPKAKTPKTETPKTKTPKTKTPKTNAPKTKTPKTKAPKTKESKNKVPKTKAPKTKAPKTKAPKTKAPKTKAPKTKAPKGKESKNKAPKTKAPKTKAPKTKAPKTKAPKTKTPKAKTPKSTNSKGSSARAPKGQAHRSQTTKNQAPKTKAPKTKAPKNQTTNARQPKTQATKNQASKNQAPKNQAPKNQAPKNQAPKSQSPSKTTPKAAAGAPAKNSKPVRKHARSLQ